MAAYNGCPDLRSTTSRVPVVRAPPAALRDRAEANVEIHAWGQQPIDAGWRGIPRLEH